MASEELKDMLNQAIARELQVAIQYMWQHVKASGFISVAVVDELKKIAIEEMKHAESIAERLDYFEGDPTTKPAPITVGKKLEEMIKLDVKAEEEAIIMYKKIIEMALKEKDYTTKYLFEGILQQEEDHHYKFTTWLKAA
nr:ferritin-like domain-containing protein [Candidatus Freyarchaeota archaeon]